MFPRPQQAFKENKWAVVLHGALCTATFVLVYRWLIPAIESQDRVTMLLAFLAQFAISLCWDIGFKIATKTWMMGFTFFLSGLLLIAFSFGSLVQTLMVVAGSVLFFRGIKLCEFDKILPFHVLVKAREAWVEWTTRPHTQKIPDGTGENGTEKREENRSDII